LAGRRVSLEDFARELRAAEVVLLQLRDKAAGPQAVLRSATVIREAMAGAGCRLILNDRADLAALAGWDGVHVGQGDSSPEDARRVLAARESPCVRGETWGTQGIVGVSTHTEAQARAAELSCADYIAIGPVFVTGTKLDASPVVGLDGVRRARALTAKPLVAIGGITRANARSVIDAGADSVAVISGLLVTGESVEKVARDFLEILR
jgi:thiamine-phosphate pyrophosphorylase